MDDFWRGATSFIAILMITLIIVTCVIVIDKVDSCCKCTDERQKQVIDLEYLIE